MAEKYSYGQFRPYYGILQTVLTVSVFRQKIPFSRTLKLSNVWRSGGANAFRIFILTAMHGHVARVYSASSLSGSQGDTLKGKLLHSAGGRSQNIDRPRKFQSAAAKQHFKLYLGVSRQNYC